MNEENWAKEDAEVIIQVMLEKANRVEELLQLVEGRLKAAFMKGWLERAGKEPKRPSHDGWPAGDI